MFLLCVSPLLHILFKLVNLLYNLFYCYAMTNYIPVCLAYWLSSFFGIITEKTIAETATSEWNGEKDSDYKTFKILVLHECTCLCMFCCILDLEDRIFSVCGSQDFEEEFQTIQQKLSETQEWVKFSPLTYVIFWSRGIKLMQLTRLSNMVYSLLGRARIGFLYAPRVHIKPI